MVPETLLLKGTECHTASFRATVRRLCERPEDAGHVDQDCLIALCRLGSSWLVHGHSGAPVSANPESPSLIISGFRVRRFASPRNDGWCVSHPTRSLNSGCFCR